MTWKCAENLVAITARSASKQSPRPQKKLTTPKPANFWGLRGNIGPLYCDFQLYPKGRWINANASVSPVHKRNKTRLFVTKTEWYSENAQRFYVALIHRYFSVDDRPGVPPPKSFPDREEIFRKLYCPLFLSPLGTLPSGTRYSVEVGSGPIPGIYGVVKNWEWGGEWRWANILTTECLHDG